MNIDERIFLYSTKIDFGKKTYTVNYYGEAGRNPQRQAEFAEALIELVREVAAKDLLRKHNIPGWTEDIRQYIDRAYGKGGAR